MCGRYALELTTEQVVTALESNGLRIDNVYDAERGLKSLNIAPTAYEPVYYKENDEHNLRYMHWGLVPSFAHEVFKFPTHNCKSDSLAHLKPMWRSAKTRRAAVPMQGYYEWHSEGKKKLPYYFKDKDAELLCVLGIWDRNEHVEDSLYSFSIVTTDAGSSIEHVHHRMPCIVRFEDGIEWIDGNWPKVLDLIMSKDDLEFYRVSTAVNKIGSKGQLNEPLKEEEVAQVGDKRQSTMDSFFSPKRIKKE